jgi:hypothetical protein
MLTNNVNLMTFELTKICKTFKISNFAKEKMETYPEDAQVCSTSCRVVVRIANNGKIRNCARIPVVNRDIQQCT